MKNFIEREKGSVGEKERERKGERGTSMEIVRPLALSSTVPVASI